MSAKRILILAPHPDDEIVGFCTHIGRAQKEGAEVFVLFLTHGCIAQKTLWPWQHHQYEARISRRRSEALKATQYLNIQIAGFSDRPARTLWQNLHQVYKETLAVLDTHQIDQLWIPAYEGGHTDHDALNGLCQRFRNQVSVLEFAEYNYANKKKNAQTFPVPNGTESILSLTKDEQTHKKKALEIYASEKNNLSYVGLTQECFRPLATYDYSKPPHTGTLWYARFHWVPFRHPRIDFTKPVEVSAALSFFAQTSALPESAKQ